MTKLSTEINASLFLDGELRIDATYYESTAQQAKAVLRKAELNGISIKYVSDYSEGTFNPPPIKRAFTDNEKIGSPYMLPQEMFDFYWEPKKHVIANKMAGIDDWYLKPGWVVLTQSGSVGKPYLATEADDGVVLSQNAIRVPCSDPAVGGFLYAYFSTWIGQTLLKKDEFGITVKHIRPHHVDEIPVPDIDDATKKTVGAKVLKAFRLRAKANELIREAIGDIYEELDAPESPVDEVDDIGAIDE